MDKFKLFDRVKGVCHVLEDGIVRERNFQGRVYLALENAVLVLAYNQKVFLVEERSLEIDDSDEKVFDCLKLIDRVYFCGSDHEDKIYVYHGDEDEPYGELSRLHGVSVVDMSIKCHNKFVMPVVEEAEVMKQFMKDCWKNYSSFTAEGSVMPHSLRKLLGNPVCIGVNSFYMFLKNYIPKCFGDSDLKVIFSSDHEYKDQEKLIVDGFELLDIIKIKKQEPNPNEPLEDHKSEYVKNDILDDKLRWNLLPLEEIEDIVRVYHAGAKKYGPNRWQHLPDGYNRYKAAMLRHLMEYEKGNHIDSDTGCLHLAQVAWNAIAMLYLSKRGEGCNQKKVEDVSCPEEDEKHDNHSPYGIYGNANLDDWLELIHKYQTTKKR